METILAIGCIVFFSVLTYALIQGVNLHKFHKYNCHTLYIPEDINIEQLFQSVNNISLDELKKTARTIGASRDFIDRFTLENDKKYLKSYIIRNSISDEHIKTTDLTKEVIVRENINKREYCNRLSYKRSKELQCPDTPATLDDYKNVDISESNKIDEPKYAFMKYKYLTPEELVIIMKKGQEEYEDRNISFMI